MNYFSRFVVIAAMLALPLTASAATAAELQAQAAALLQQVQALQSQLGAQSGTTAGSASATGSTGYCPNIGRSLKRTSTGDDVSRLQRFLAQDPVIYPEGIVSGYFGALTEAAVQRWQVKFHIVSSGTPETTGYGVVGPRTAAAIAIVCGGGSYNGVSGTVNNVTSAVGGFIQVSPISGNAPLTVNVQATVNTTNACGGAIYTLNFGDGTNPQVIPSSAGVCQQQTATFSHMYQYGGSYTITLSAGTHQTNATVTVFGATAPVVPVQTGSTQTTNVVMSDSAFTPRNLTVLPGTTITWTNTGTMNHTVTADNNSFNSGVMPPAKTYTQTFTTVGSYPYYCQYHGAAGGSGMSGTITVAAATTPTPSTPTTPSTPYTYGPMSVTPGANGNALSAQAQFDRACASYSINWGDGPAIVAAAPDAATCTTPNTITVTHTYTQSGSYTITLTRGTRTDTAAIVISTQ